MIILYFILLSIMASISYYQISFITRQNGDYRIVTGDDYLLAFVSLSFTIYLIFRIILESK